MKHWITALRLRTLPLALSCIIVGCGSAYADGYFNPTLTVLLLLTTLFLQVLSNLANDSRAWRYYSDHMLIRSIHICFL